jgi:hypothetical protein
LAHGFGTACALRKVFVRHLGTSPHSFRRLGAVDAALADLLRQIRQPEPFPLSGATGSRAARGATAGVTPGGRRTRGPSQVGIFASWILRGTWGKSSAG